MNPRELYTERIQTLTEEIYQLNRQRREAIRELSENASLRTAFLAQARGRQIDTAAITEALHAVQQLRISRLAAHRFTYVAALGSILVFYGLLAGAVFGPLARAFPMLWVLLEITVVYLLFGRTLKRVSQSINIILPRLGTYVGLIMQIVTSDLKSQEGRDIIRQLSADEQDAIKSFRLQQLIETCRQKRHTLIILDEILKGTNSLDKLNGSRLFLQSVATQPVTGIIATHDLEVSKMADEYPDRFHNHCFEIELSDNVTYTYKITEGVARNQNATFLLKNIVLREE